jgi:hypothetical protein
METDDLIAALSSDLPPVRANSVRRTIVLGLVIGMLITVIALAMTLGMRKDLHVAMAGAMFWMKIGYTASLALIAIAAAIVLARPEARPPRWLWLLAFPVAVLGAISAFELSSAPADHRMAMWLGETWALCPANLVMLSLPIMITVMIGYRRFAPTHMRITGAVIGLGAGAAAATVYCLHCPEETAIFVLTWYSLGIAVATVIGAIAGPRFLRW